MSDERKSIHDGWTPEPQAEKQERQIPTCPLCDNEIDPEICWCGDYVKQHSIYSGHSPVPMGCTCGCPTLKEDNEAPF